MSPRQNLNFIERVLRRRLRDERSVTLAGIDPGQVRHLKDLRRRLRSDPMLDVSGWRGQADGVTYLMVSPAGLLGIGESGGKPYRLVSAAARRGRGRTVHGWWGAPKVR